MKVQVAETTREQSLIRPMLYFAGGRVPVAVFQFGDFKFDCGKFELCRKGQRLKLERKPLELLALLVTKHGQIVSRTEIAGLLWEREVFVDTEHGINTAIRKIRQTLGDDPEAPHFVQTISGSGYRFIAPVTQLQPEPQPQPTQENPSISTTGPSVPPNPGVPVASSARKSNWNLWLTLAAGAVVLIAVLALTLGSHPLAARLLHRNTQPAITSLAVLPLDNLSGDPNQEYFADGMTNELITQLARDSSLLITSRTSVMQYKGAHRPLPEIARALNVDGILEGSISRGDGKVHMTLQLIRADTDTNIWAQSYNRSPNDVAALPDEAARDIATRLQSSVPIPTAVRYVNPDAHDAYLRGLYLWYALHFDEAAQYFRKAVKIQPDYALGWSGLAVCYDSSTVTGRVDPRIALPLGAEPAIRALALDPSLPQAHHAMSGSLFLYHWDWNRADQEVLRAIELDPRFAEAYHLRARILTAINHSDEAIVVEKKAMELDPFARPWGMVEIYFRARQYDAAIADARLRLENSPDNLNLRGLIVESFHCKGMNKEATDALVQLYSAAGDLQSASAIQHAYQAGGYKAVVRWRLSALEKEAHSLYVSPVHLANFHAQLGEREKTLALLEEGFRQHSPQILWIQTDAAYDFLHDDPRYRSLIQRIGLPPAY